MMARYFGDEEKPSIESLMHYGVKGMKWGVRRETMAPSTMSKAERKEAKTNARKLSNKVFDSKYGDDFFQRKMTQEQYNKLSTKTHVVKKGQEVGRVTSLKDDKLGDVTYVSYKPHDRDLYRAIMPVVNSGPFKRGGNKKYKNSYEATYKTLETLKSPSEKERVDAFSNLFDTPAIKLKNGKTIDGREFMKRDFPKEVKTLSSHQLGLLFYNRFTDSQGAKTPLNTAYFNSLKEKGYNAIVDDNDRGHLSDTPLMILDPNGRLKRTKIKALTADEINNAQRRLQVES